MQTLKQSALFLAKPLAALALLSSAVAATEPEPVPPPETLKEYEGFNRCTLVAMGGDSLKLDSSGYATRGHAESQETAFSFQLQKVGTYERSGEIKNNLFLMRNSHDPDLCYFATPPSIIWDAEVQHRRCDPTDTRQHWFFGSGGEAAILKKAAASTSRAEGFRTLRVDNVRMYSTGFRDGDDFPRLLLGRTGALRPTTPIEEERDDRYENVSLVCADLNTKETALPKYEAEIIDRYAKTERASQIVPEVCERQERFADRLLSGTLAQADPGRGHPTAADLERLVVRAQNVFPSRPDLRSLFIMGILNRARLSNPVSPDFDDPRVGVEVGQIVQEIGDYLNPETFKTNAASILAQIGFMTATDDIGPARAIAKYVEAGGRHVELRRRLQASPNGRQLLGGGASGRVRTLMSVQWRALRTKFSLPGGEGGDKTYSQNARISFMPFGTIRTKDGAAMTTPANGTFQFTVTFENDWPSAYKPVYDRYKKLMETNEVLPFGYERPPASASWKAFVPGAELHFAFTCNGVTADSCRLDAVALAGLVDYTPITAFQDAGTTILFRFGNAMISGALATMSALKGDYKRQAELSAIRRMPLCGVVAAAVKPLVSLGRIAYTNYFNTMDPNKQFLKWREAKQVLLDEVGFSEGMLEAAEKAFINANNAPAEFREANAAEVSKIRADRESLVSEVQWTTKDRFFRIGFGGVVEFNAQFVWLNPELVYPGKYPFNSKTPHFLPSGLQIEVQATDNIHTAWPILYPRPNKDSQWFYGTQPLRAQWTYAGGGFFSFSDDVHKWAQAPDGQALLDRLSAK